MSIGAIRGASGKGDPCAGAPTVATCVLDNKTNGVCDLPTASGFTYDVEITTSPATIPVGFELLMRASWQQTDGAPSYTTLQVFDNGDGAGPFQINGSNFNGTLDFYRGNNGAADWYAQAIGEIRPAGESEVCDSLESSQIFETSVEECP